MKTKNNNTVRKLLEEFFGAGDGIGNETKGARDGHEPVVHNFAVSDNITNMGVLAKSIYNAMMPHHSPIHKTEDYEQNWGYHSFSEAVGKYIEKYNLGKYLLKLANSIDRAMYESGKTYAVSVNNRAMPYHPREYEYGEIKSTQMGKRYRFDISINSVLGTLSKYSGLARQFMEFSLIHELMHAKQYALGIGKFESIVEGTANAAAAKYYMDHNPDSFLGKAMKSVYFAGNMTNKVLDGAKGIILPYARETYNAIMSYGKEISSLLRGAYSTRYVRPSMASIPAYK